MKFNITPNHATPFTPSSLPDMADRETEWNRLLDNEMDRILKNKYAHLAHITDRRMYRNTYDT